MKELLCMFYPFESDTRKQLNEKLICVSFTMVLFIYIASINKLIYKEGNYITIPLESAYIEHKYPTPLRGSSGPLVKIIYGGHSYQVHCREYREYNYCLLLEKYAANDPLPKMVKIIPLYTDGHIITSEFDSFIYGDKIIKNQYAYKTISLEKSITIIKHVVKYAAFFYFFFFLFLYLIRKRDI